MGLGALGKISLMAPVLADAQAAVWMAALTVAQAMPDLNNEQERAALEGLARGVEKLAELQTEYGKLIRQAIQEAYDVHG